jgi:hypothetical protein
MTDRFVHQACRYGSDEEFVSVAVPFIRDGLAAGEAVLATTSAANLDLLDQSLGDDARHVDVAESAYFGRRPPQRVAAFHRYWRENASRGRVRILAEPMWLGWAPLEINAWVRMEAGLNVVLAGAPVSMICPYDTRVLRPDIAASALNTHPLLAEPGGTRPSPEYTDPEGFAAACEAAAAPAPPPDDAAVFEHDTRQPRALREFAAEQARRHDLDGERAELFVFAVHELAAYLSQESAGRAVIRIWPGMGTLDCELEVPGGRLPDPFAGYRPPDDDARPDDRLWIARQLCDSLEIRRTESGVAARLAFAGARSAEQAQRDGGVSLA